MFIKKDDANVVVALEVGTSKIAAAVAELRRDGTMTLVGVGEAPSSGIRKGEVVDFQDAQTCVRQALHNAEKETDAEIQEVYLLLTGAHIMSRTETVRTTILDDDRLITQDHLDELDDMADKVTIPRDNVVIHKLLQNYRLDNGTVSLDPIGLSSQSLEADFHLIYGLHTRLQTTVRCVAEQGISVSGYALSSFAMAQAILPRDAKKAGAIAIDLGAGVSDYIVYVDGNVVHTGVLGVGGDHLTQDLALGLRLPYQKAEQLKKKYGDLYFSSRNADERIIIEGDTTFEERAIYRESMVKILAARQKETLSLIYDDIDQLGIWDKITGGVYITGGASQINGLQRMAEEIFSMPAQLVHEHVFDGDQTYSKRPDLSALLGMLRYAQQKEMKRFKPQGWRKIRESIVGLLEAMRLL